MATQSPPSRGYRPSPSATIRSTCGVPWPIWVVVAFLVLESLGNLLAIPQTPMATRWLAAKILFIAGLIRGWRWVYILFLVVAGYHVLGFSMTHPFVAGLNMGLVVLAGCSWRHYFPGCDLEGTAKGPKKPTPEGFDPEFDA